MKNIIRISLLVSALAGGAAFAQQPAPRHEECRDCGVVQSVQKVTRTERAKGIAGTPVTPGMAIGGVLGGVLGNQVGGGTGRSLATVGGVAAGGYVGHKLEEKRYTAYVMHIRMDDGRERTIEQRTPIARGSHVIVEGHTARLERAEPRHG
jgi:outer membrane lipoprotein SlyB